MTLNSPGSSGMLRFAKISLMLSVIPLLYNVVTMRQLPKEIAEVGFDFDWDVEKVWALDLPTRLVDRQFLEWHLGVKFLWTQPDGYYDLTPREVLENPDAYPKEMKRVEKADLKYPIDYMQWNGRPLILDGLHRLMKCNLLEIDQISVREVPVEFVPQILKDNNA